MKKIKKEKNRFMQLERIAFFYFNAIIVIGQVFYKKIKIVIVLIEQIEVSYNYFEVIDKSIE